MDARQFLAEFGHIANAPGGIGKLRELVIQLAISGRLVERIELEATASEEIEAAAELRRVYEEELDLRATRMHPPLHSKPFPVPDHWLWTRLEQICLYIQRGKGPKYVERSSTRVISQKSVQWSAFDLSSARFVADDSLDSYGKERFLCAGDLLWNSTGTGTAGRVAIYQPDESVTAVADSHVTVVRLASCSPRYLWCVIASPWVQSRIEPLHPDSLVSGTTQQVELNTSTARALPIPLPPIQEQSRIVVKVDELMALCDTLEAQQRARRKLQNNLRQSTLQTVASASSPVELQTSWARLTDNFGWLFHAAEDVDDFVAELKSMAVRGLLCLPSISRSPVDAVVADCNSLRDQYITSGLMRRQKLISVAASDVVYPRHWAIAPFDKVAVVIGGVTKGRDLRGRDVVTCPYLAVANVQRGFFKLTELKTIQIGKDELNKYLVKAGDLLITEGGDWDKVGRTAIWKGGVDNCLHQNHVFKARIPSSSLINEWVQLVFNSGIGRDYFAGYVDLEQFAKFSRYMKWPLPLQLTHEFTRGGTNLDSKAAPWLAGAIASGPEDGTPRRKHDTSDGNKARSLRKLVAMLLLRAYAKRFNNDPRIAIQELEDVKRLRPQIALDLKVLGLRMDDTTIVTNLAEVGEENSSDELTILLAEVLSKHSEHIRTGINRSKPRPK